MDSDGFKGLECGGLKLINLFHWICLDRFGQLINHVG